MTTITSLGGPNVGGIQTTGVQNAAAAEPSAGNGRKLNIKDIPFRVAIEVTHWNSNASRRLASAGWSVNTSYGDCSHGQSQYQGYYARMESPPLQHGKAAWDSIKSALDAARENGARLGPHGSMKILIRNDKMDVDTLKELYRMHASAEPIIYNVGQNGAGYHAGHNTINTTPYGFTIQSDNPKGNFYFCLPVSNVDSLMSHLSKASSVEGLSSALKAADPYHYNGNHWGFLPRSPKVDANYAEFRYFTGTLDPDAVKADVEMVLGMIKAAHEGRWPKDMPAQPLKKFEKSPIEHRVYDAFMREVMGGMEAPGKVEDLFRKSGGQVSRPAVSAEDVGRLQQLQKSGFSFDWGKGQLDSIVYSDNPVKITEAGQQTAYEVPGKAFLQFLAAETGAAESQDPAVRAIAGTLRELRSAGVTFATAGATQPLTSTQGPALLLKTGKLEATVDNKRVPLADRNDFEKLAYIVLGKKFPLELRDTADGAIELGKKGYTFTDPTSQTRLDTPLAILRQLSVGGVAVRLPGSTTPTVLQSPQQAGEFFAVENGHLDKLPADKANVILLAHELRSMGYNFQHADGKYDPKAQLLVPNALAEGKLTYTGPGVTSPTKFQGDFDKWARATLGHTGELDEAGRQTILEWGRLQSSGAQLVEANGTPSSRPLLGILYAGQPVHVRLAGEAPRQFANADALMAFMRERNEMLAKLPGEQLTALERLDTLRQGANLQVTVGGVPLQSAQQVAWNLHDKHPISIASPQGGTPMEVSDFSGLQQTMAIESGATAELPAATARMLQGFTRLRDQKVQFYQNGTPVAFKSQQIDALNGGSLKLHLPSRIWWGMPFRKYIKATTAEHLETISRRLAS